MQNRFEPAQRRLVAEHPPPDFLPVDRPVSRHPGERRFYRRNRGPVFAQQPVYLGVGIVHGHAELSQDGGGPGLAHTDRAGHAQNDRSPCHAERIQVGMSKTKRRRSAVTSGSTPNQAAKPGLA